MQPTQEAALDEQAQKLVQLREKANKTKKRVLIVCLSLIGAVALLFGLVTLIDYLVNRAPDIPEYNFHFYPTYEGDIMQNQQYLGLDRQIYFCEDPSGEGLKRAVNEENMTEYDTKVLFLYFYLQTIISGKEDVYNGYFNDTYYKTNQPKADFSPQMLYEMEITYQGTQTLDGGEQLVSYRLIYKIFQNDGTFRRDIGSNSGRPQTITLRVSADGTITIEKLVTHYEITK